MCAGTKYGGGVGFGARVEEGAFFVGDAARSNELTAIKSVELASSAKQSTGRIIADSFSCCSYDERGSTATCYP